MQNRLPVYWIGESSKHPGLAKQVVDWLQNQKGVDVVNDFIVEPNLKDLFDKFAERTGQNIEWNAERNGILPVANLNLIQKGRFVIALVDNESLENGMLLQAAVMSGIPTLALVSTYHDLSHTELLRQYAKRLYVGRFHFHVYSDFESLQGVITYFLP